MREPEASTYEIHLTFGPASEVEATIIAEAFQRLLDLWIEDRPEPVLTALTVAHTKVFDSRG